MKAAIIATIIALVFFGLLVAAMPQNNDKGPLEKITFVHYKENKGNAFGKTKAGTSCYAFLASGAKWKTAEPYLINTANSDGLQAAFVQSTVDAGVAEWKAYGGNIFGTGSIDNTADYNNGDLDGKNTVSFGSYSDPNVIAVTTVWGYFSGAQKNRELLEWDMLFNDSGFAFGNASINPALMDLQNIATHELGHSAGMGDLYSTACSEETMYGYSSEGETKKQTLNTGDIAGIQKLYG